MIIILVKFWAIGLELKKQLYTKCYLFMNKKYLEVEKLLIKAYYQLFEIEDYQTITVTQVCQYSNVSRKSYYHHFKNNNEILELIMKNKGMEFQEYCDSKNGVINKENITYQEYYLAYKRFFEFWFNKENKHFIELMSKQSLLYRFSSYINYKDFSCVKYDLDKFDDNKLLKEYYPHMANAILLEVLEQWSIRGFKENSDDLASIMMASNEIFSKYL